MLMDIDLRTSGLIASLNYILSLDTDQGFFPSATHFIDYNSISLECLNEENVHI